MIELGSRNSCDSSMKTCRQNLNTAAARDLRKNFQSKSPPNETELPKSRDCLCSMSKSSARRIRTPSQNSSEVSAARPCRTIWRLDVTCSGRRSPERTVERAHGKRCASQALLRIPLRYSLLERAGAMGQRRAIDVG